MGTSAARGKSIATRIPPTFRTGGYPRTAIQSPRRRLRLRRRGRPRQHPGHQDLEVAANLGQTVATAAMTTLVGAISLLRTVKFAPEPSIPVPQRRRAVVMRQPQCLVPASAARVVVQAAPIQMIGATRTMQIAPHALGNGALRRANLLPPVQSASAGAALGAIGTQRHGATRVGARARELAEANGVSDWRAMLARSPCICLYRRGR